MAGYTYNDIMAGYNDGDEIPYQFRVIYTIHDKIKQYRQGENILEWINELIKDPVMLKKSIYYLMFQLLFVENNWNFEWDPCMEMVKYLINNADPMIIRGACKGYIIEDIIRNKADDLFMMMVNKCDVPQIFNKNGCFRVGIIHNSKTVMEYYMNQYESKKDVLTGYAILGAFVKGKNKVFTRWMKTQIQNEDFYRHNPYIILDIITHSWQQSNDEESNTKSVINNTIRWCMKHNMLIDYNLDDILNAIINRSRIFKWYECYADILDKFEIHNIPEVFFHNINSFEYFVLKRGVKLAFNKLTTRMYDNENVHLLIEAFRNNRITNIPENWVASVNCFPMAICHKIFQYFVNTYPVGKNEFRRFVKLNKNAPQIETLYLFIDHPTFDIDYWYSLPLADRKMFIQKLCIMNNTYDLSTEMGITHTINNFRNINFEGDVYKLIEKLYHINLGDMVKLLYSSLTYQPIYEIVTEAYVSLIIEDFVYAYKR